MWRALARLVLNELVNKSSLHYRLHPAVPTSWTTAAGVSIRDQIKQLSRHEYLSELFGRGTIVSHSISSRFPPFSDFPASGSAGVSPSGRQLFFLSKGSSGV